MFTPLRFRTNAGCKRLRSIVLINHWANCIICKSGYRCIREQAPTASRRRCSLSFEPTVCSTIARAVTVAFICLLGVAAPVMAQESAKPSPDKWRPKNGIYAERGADFATRCGEFGDLRIGLGKGSISGSEWGCQIKKVTDTAPGSIRLDLTCSDYNLALNINPRAPNTYERTFKEILLLKRANETTISVRKTLNGKFSGSWQASYCPEDAQRSYAEEQARNQTEAERIDAIKHPWHPQDGLYAVPGADFENRCLKGGDAAINLTEKSISRGAEKCSVTFPRAEPNALQLFVTCRQEPIASGVAEKAAEDTSTTPARPETILLRGTPAKKDTVFLQISRKREFSAPEEELSYCGPDAQKLYASQKARK